MTTDIEKSTVDELVVQALNLGLIKNKTAGVKLRKAGLMDLLKKHFSDQAATLVDVGEAVVVLPDLPPVEVIPADEEAAAYADHQQDAAAMAAASLSGPHGSVNTDMHAAATLVGFLNAVGQGAVPFTPPPTPPTLPETLVPPEMPSMYAREVRSRPHAFKVFDREKVRAKNRAARKARRKNRR